jgi:hypothetical protein
MKQLTKKKELIISLSCGLALICFSYAGFFIGRLIGLLFVIIAFIVGAFSLYVFFGLIVNSIRFKTFLKSRLVNILFVGFSLFIVIFQPIEQIIEKMKSPVIFSGTCEHTVTFVWILLREDKTFDYNAGGFLERIIYNGTYKIKDDSLFLKFKKKVSNNISDTLIIDQYGLKETTLRKKHQHFFKGQISKIKK